MIVTVFKDRAGFELAEYNMAWPDLVDWIKNPPVAASKSELPLIKLARFGDVRSKRGSLRHDRNVLGVHGIEADYDGEQMPPERAVELLQAANVRAVVYTSASHTPQTPRWRVLAPLTCEFPPDQRRAFIERLNGALGGVLSAESFTLSQAFYFGRVEGVPYDAWPTLTN